MKEKLTVRKQNNFEFSTLNIETRSVGVVAATEKPVKIWDWERGEVDEILLMTGARLPKSGSIPLTIEHERRAGAVIGSLREISAGKDLKGRVFFSEAPDAEPYWIKTREGHLEFFSIAYGDRKSIWIDAGKKKEISGRVFTGPVLVTTKWTPCALGLVLYPADEKAKARAKTQKEVNNMDPKLRKFLERSGLDESATEEQAWAFLERMKVEPDKPDAERGKPAETDAVAETPAPTGGTIPISPEAAARRAGQEAVDAERKRVAEIRGICRAAKTPDIEEESIMDGATPEMVRAKVLEILTSRDAGPPVTIHADERDKFRSAAEQALLFRAGLPIENPDPENYFRGYSMVEIARETCRLTGVDHTGDPLAMVGRAMMTEDFPILLGNLAHKSILEGWEGAGEQWADIFDDTGSVSDFKIHTKVRPGEGGDLKKIPAGGRYDYDARAEEMEQYFIETFGKMTAITRQAIINDDLDALSDTPREHGEAAARKVADVVWTAFTSNAAMGDGIALFHASHGNLNAGGAGSPNDVTRIAALLLAMETQKDIGGKRRIKVVPKWFLAPAALRGIMEMFFGTNNLAATGDTDALKATLNPYAGTRFKQMYEPRLDDISATAHYWLTDQKRKTVKAFFLNGNKVPFMDSQRGWDVDGWTYKVRIDVGAKAMSWRGMAKNDGA